MTTNRVTFDFPWHVGDTDMAEIGVMDRATMGRTSTTVSDENLFSLMQFLTKAGFNPTHEMA